MKGQRDPRAWWIDEDPFETMKKSNLQSSARDDGKWRQQRAQVIQVGENGRLVTNIFGNTSNMHTISMHRGSIWHFSSKEIRDLGLATGAFTIALALMFDGGLIGLSSNFPIFCIYSLISLAPAFILHEFAHKFVARYYGCWAEFRADPGGLRFGLILAAFLGVVFMAPGAVVVAGNATRDQFGKIAVAGPVTNMILWSTGFLAWLILGGLFSPIDLIISYWLWGNSFLCAFNMLPFGPLDGRKIKTWSEPIFYTCLSVAVAMVYVTWNSTSI